MWFATYLPFRVVGVSKNSFGSSFSLVLHQYFAGRGTRRLKATYPAWDKTHAAFSRSAVCVCQGRTFDTLKILLLHSGAILTVKNHCIRYFGMSL